MGRWLGNLVLIAASLAWLVAAGLWARSWIRADVVGVVLPGHLYVEAEIDDGSLQVEGVPRWPTGPTAVWSSGPAEASDADDSLSGPHEFFSTRAWGPSWEWRWRGFGLSHHQAWFMTTDRGLPDMRVQRRNFDVFASGPIATPPVPMVPVFAATMPTWAPLAAASAAIASWMATAGRRRLRVRRRRAKGLCTHCGYDRRHTVGRCPECGAEGPGQIRFRGLTEELLVEPPSDL